MSEVAFEKLIKLHNNSLNDSANEEKAYLVTNILPIGEPFTPLSLAGHSMIHGQLRTISFRSYGSACKIAKGVEIFTVKLLVS